MKLADNLAHPELALVVAAVLTRVSLDPCHNSPAAVGPVEVFDPAVTAANCSEHHSHSAVAAVAVAAVAAVAAVVADTVEAVEVRAAELDVVVVVVEVVYIYLAALEDSVYSVRTASVVLEGAPAHETRDPGREKL